MAITSLHPTTDITTIPHLHATQLIPIRHPPGEHQLKGEEDTIHHTAEEDTGLPMGAAYPTGEVHLTEAHLTGVVHLTAVARLTEVVLHMEEGEVEDTTEETDTDTKSAKLFVHPCKL